MACCQPWTYVFCVFGVATIETEPTSRYLKTLRPRKNGRIFLNENVSIAIKISLKFVPKGPINNILALVQIMAWRWSGDKPLSEPMMTSFADAYMRRSASMS